ncbi:MAG TPA: hypothetical protein VFM18_20700 [Methanosarcina sp.]|nr:hypothetical protein [Methanosarcina sp.]
MDELEKLKEITRQLQEMRKELDELDDYYQRRTEEVRESMAVWENN